MKERKSIERVQRSLVCTMQIEEELGNIQDQLAIIEKAKAEISMSQASIERLNNFINVELNRFLNQKGTE